MQLIHTLHIILETVFPMKESEYDNENFYHLVNLFVPYFTYILLDLLTYAQIQYT